MSTNPQQGKGPVPFDPWTTIAVAVLVFYGSILVALLLLGVIGVRPPMTAGGELASAVNDPEVAQYLIDHLLVQNTVGLALLYGLVQLRSRNRAREYLSLDPVPVATLLRWLGITAVFVLAGSVVDGLVRHILEIPAQPDPLGAADIGLVFVVAAVIAVPAFEETLFRGFLFQGFRQTPLGTIGAALLATAIWTALHAGLDLLTAFFIFGLGMIFAMARIKTGSLLVPIVLHAAYNASSLIFDGI